MKTINSISRPVLLTFLALANIVVSARAQEVTIPDPGLSAAIRVALQQTNAPLTQLDMLRLTNLNARSKNVSSIAGLEAARNLVSLDLEINRLTNFSLPKELTNLVVFDVSVNPLTNFTLPSGITKLTSLTLESAGLTHLTLPAGLTRLTNLDLEGNQLTNFNQLSNLTALVTLDLGFNAFANFSLPGVLTNLSTFYFAGNPLTNIVLPPGLAGMTELNLSQNLLTGFTLPPGMTKLSELDLAFNQLTNLSLPADLRNLTELELDSNQLTALKFPSNLNSLAFLHLRANQFTNFNVPAELTGLTYLDVSANPLRNFTLPGSLNHLESLLISKTPMRQLTLPAGLTNLIALNLSGNQLTNLVLPSDLSRLESLNLGGNELTHFTVPAGLTNLVGFFVTGNQLATLTLPPDLSRLSEFGFLANPLTRLVLPETLAATNLADDVAALRNQGVVVFTYPLTIRLVAPREEAGNIFEFALVGPPGVYTLLASTNLDAWSPLGIVTNELGGVRFADLESRFAPRKFYRAQVQSAPPDMVFIPPTTFNMGSPAHEQDRNINEGPQTTVTLTRGFWIGKHEVTQGEYLSVMNTNPSIFLGDPSLPVSSVSWPEATNYCAKLTQRELAAGRISPGSQYRLPTEAEWECAARAGSSTRFSYGDDPSYASLTNHAWFASNGRLTVHPVGQKLPNPFGLYDMTGNVWEWCQDWFGPLPGGVQMDPTGPASNPIGNKVMRGGAYDAFDSSCRSAARNAFPAGLFLTDSDLGFRVVLVTQ